MFPNEVEQAIKQSREATQLEKAEAWKAKRNAEENRAWHEFLKFHSGARGANNGFYFCCEANNRLLAESIATQSNKQITFQALEEAYRSCRDRLAPPPDREYKRKTNTLESRSLPQLVNLPIPAVVLPYTKQQILSWDAKRLKREMRSPERVTAINKILNS